MRTLQAIALSLAIVIMLGFIGWAFWQTGWLQPQVVDVFDSSPVECVWYDPPRRGADPPDCAYSITH